MLTRCLPHPTLLYLVLPLQQIVLNKISLPWTISEAQLVVGSIFALPLWLLRLRQAPGLTEDNIEGLKSIAFCHMISHVSAVIGLGGKVFEGMKTFYIPVELLRPASLFEFSATSG